MGIGIFDKIFGDCYGKAAFENCCRDCDHESHGRCGAIVRKEIPGSKNHVTGRSQYFPDIKYDSNVWTKARFDDPYPLPLCEEVRGNDKYCNLFKIAAENKFDV